MWITSLTLEVTCPQGADLDDKIQHCLKCAGTAFGRLKHRVFQDHDICKDTKMSVYKAVVIPTLLYASETWTTYQRHLRTLEKFDHAYEAS